MIGKRLKYFVKSSTGEKISFLTKQYFVFKDGRIFDNSRKEFVKQRENKNGYMIVNLTDDDGKQQTSIGVHRIVASAFLRLLEKGEVVHHIDHDRKNNNLFNLEIIPVIEHQRQHALENWAAGLMGGVAAKSSEYMKKAWSNGTYDGFGAKIRKAWAAGAYEVRVRKLSKQVAQIDKNGNLIHVWPSTMAAKRSGYSQGDVSACCRGEYKTHKGYRWMWYNEYLAQQETPKEQWESRQLFLDFSE